MISYVLYLYIGARSNLYIYAQREFLCTNEIGIIVAHSMVLEIMCNCLWSIFIIVTEIVIS